jgi:hypothetical protein
MNFTSERLPERLPERTLGRTTHPEARRGRATASLRSPVSIGLVKVSDPLCSVKADLIVTRLELAGKMRDLALTLEAVDHQTDDVENSDTCLSSTTFRKQSPNHPRRKEIDTDGD